MSVEALKRAEIGRGVYTSGDKSEKVKLCYERRRKECIDGVCARALQASGL